MPLPVPEPVSSTESAMLQWKLWIYTNYDCNLRCSYCVAQSSPNAPRRAIGLANAKRLVEEAVDLGFMHIYFTGGEPFLLNDIFEMLAYSSARVTTSILTNGLLFKQKIAGTEQTRLDKLTEISNENLIIQVSLDGGQAEHHDAYRGAGTWEKTVEGIKLLQERGFRVRLSSTETPANSAHLSKICDFHHALGIPDEDHFIRPLAKRGYSKEGLELGPGNLVPELTATREGIFWHPLSTEADMQVSKKIFPLAAAKDRVQAQLDEMTRTGTVPLLTFT